MRKTSSREQGFHAISLSESPMKSVGGALIVADPGVPNNERAGHTCGASVIQRQVALPATRRGGVVTVDKPDLSAPMFLRAEFVRNHRDCVHIHSTDILGFKYL